MCVLCVCCVCVCVCVCVFSPVRCADVDTRVSDSSSSYCTHYALLSHLALTLCVVIECFPTNIIMMVNLTCMYYAKTIPSQ